MKIAIFQTSTSTVALKIENVAIFFAAVHPADQAQKETLLRSVSLQMARTAMRQMMRMSLMTTLHCCQNVGLLW